MKVDQSRCYFGAASREFQRRVNLMFGECRIGIRLSHRTIYFGVHRSGGTASRCSTTLRTLSSKGARLLGCKPHERLGPNASSAYETGLEDVESSAGDERPMKNELFVSLCSSALLFLGLIGSGLAAGLEHFDPAGAAASAHTRALQHALRESLPFEDRRDFEESRRGLIAQPANRQIVDANGNIIWDMSRYDFLLGSEEFDSIHPSLQRQAQLNMNHGLFEVVPDFLYQVRGFNLANMTPVRGETGWILFDVMQTGETSAAALALANESLGEMPVRAVVYSHSHIDHFGGVHGVISEADVTSGDVQVFAPKGFMQAVASDNVYARTAISLRAKLYARRPPVP